MTEVLDFSFDNTSDINLPPTAGPNRQIRFDDAPVIEMVERTKKDAKVMLKMARFRGKICDGGQGTYPTEENDRMLFIDCDLADPMQATLAKRIFLAARINPQGMSFGDAAAQLKGKIIGVDFKHSNSKPSDKNHPCVYGNVRDANVPADMLTNVPGKTADRPVIAPVVTT